MIQPTNRELVWLRALVASPVARNSRAILVKDIQQYQTQDALDHPMNRRKDKRERFSKTGHGWHPSSVLTPEPPVLTLPPFPTATTTTGALAAQRLLL